MLLGLLTSLVHQLHPSPSLHANLSTDFYTICGVRQHSSSLSLGPVVYCSTLLSLSPYSNLRRRPHHAPNRFRSFRLEWIDRPDQSAANCLQILNFAASNLLATILATGTLCCQLILLRNQFVTGTIPQALARSSSSCSDWNAH